MGISFIQMLAVLYKGLEHLWIVVPEPVSCEYRNDYFTPLHTP